jgi:hypothetical protein
VRALFTVEFENYSFAVELRSRRLDLDGTTDPGSGDFLARMKARVEDWEQRTDAVSAHARTPLDAPAP